MNLPIYYFKMPSQYWMTSTFLRFQEFYESPKFRGLGFSLEEFQDWYSSQMPKGQFSYYNDWVGFNFPSYVVDGFTPNKFGAFTRKENWVLDQLRDAPEKYYCIATAQDGFAIEHELVHALYYLNADYSKQVDATINDYKFRAFKSALVKRGYHEEVLVDEINAYLTTGLIPSLSKKSRKDVLACQPKLLKLFESMFGFDINNSDQVEKFIGDNIQFVDCSTVVVTK